MFLGICGGFGNGHSEAWGVVAPIGFALTIMSLPVRTYGLYAHSRHTKAEARNKSGG